MGRVVIAVRRVVVRRKVKVSEEGGFKSYPFPSPSPLLSWGPQPEEILLFVYPAETDALHGCHYIMILTLRSHYFVGGSLNSSLQIN